MTNANDAVNFFYGYAPINIIATNDLFWINELITMAYPLL